MWVGVWAAEEGKVGERVGAESSGMQQEEEEVDGWVREVCPHADSRTRLMALEKLVSQYMKASELMPSRGQVIRDWGLTGGRMGPLDRNEIVSLLRRLLML